jgi:hypothetical protein
MNPDFLVRLYCLLVIGMCLAFGYWLVAGDDDWT